MLHRWNWKAVSLVTGLIIWLIMASLPDYTLLFNI